MIYLLSLNHDSKLHQRSFLDCSLSHYIHLIFCFAFLEPKRLKKEKIDIDFLPYIFNTHLWETQFSDGIGKIIFLTPSSGSKIRLTRKSTGSQMKIIEGRNVVRWYPSISICRMESDGIHGNPTESIHVHRNYWSCGKPYLRQVQHTRNMPRSQSLEAKHEVWPIL